MPKVTFRDILEAKKRAAVDVSRIRLKRTRTARPTFVRIRRPVGRLHRRNIRFRRRAATGSSVRSLTRHMEQKYIPIGRLDEHAPTAIQTGAIVYQTCCTLGHVIPPNWSGSYVLLYGTQVSVGDGINCRDGNQVYLQNTPLRYTLDMSSFGNVVHNKPPIQFRVVAFKSKLSYLSGGTHDPGKTLFLNETDTAFGTQTPGAKGSDLMLFKTNRRNFRILKDFKFTLSHPAAFPVNLDPASATVPGTSNTIGLNAGFTSKYPTSKNFNITLPHNRKVHYNTSNEPDNYNPAWSVAIIARSQGHDAYANGWELNLRACTKFKDI